jgi:uncharacterized protein (DUF58 family)
VIRPTALGWKALAFLAALTAAFFAAPYQNLYFLLLAFLFSLGAMNALWTARNVAGVKGDVPPIAAFPAGAPYPFTVTIDGGRRTRFELRAVLDLGQRGRVTARADATGGVFRATGEIPALPRGVHSVRRAWIETTYPLGLLRARRRIAVQAELVVHPAPTSIPNAPGGGAAGLAAAIAGAAGADQPSGLRDFRDGDEIRAIHWRATARRGRPVVTEWDASAGEGMELVLDRRADEQALEGALSLVAALAIAARDAKERLTIHTQGMSRTFGPGHAPWEELLRTLAGADRLPPDAPPPPPAATTVLRLPLRREKVTA